ncbi:hypothetical protein D9619_010471 [Psilocybe cf. subviscida]|uniref:Uncharacterized protein n=1 Tax=Psilocybe cf. subviscida TaxID=2480587 RepID=A0A8H5ES11_9AGAR|nr:hypothetical protein D9619_010471 [Psilocybe cf. subviscida]
MALPPTKFMSSLHEKYSDDDTTKELFIQADGLRDYPGFGDRHVLIYWYNNAAPSTPENNGQPAIQITQLTGQAGNYAYYAPVVHSVPPAVMAQHLQIFLGTLTRAQRDEMLALADAVQFNRKSTVNGCRVWTRDLLWAMVGADLITQEKFDEVDKKIPLVMRVPEA